MRLSVSHDGARTLGLRLCRLILDHRVGRSSRSGTLPVLVVGQDDEGLPQSPLENGVDFLVDRVELLLGEVDRQHPDSVDEVVHPNLKFLKFW